MQGARHVVGSDGLYADKGAIEMQVGGMYEADTGHVILTAAVWWMGKYSQPGRVSLTCSTAGRHVSSLGGGARKQGESPVLGIRHSA